MHGFKKAFGRTTQKIKRTVSSRSAHKDPEYDMLMQSIQIQEKTLAQFDKHVLELTRHIEGQMAIARGMAHDYRMIYAREGITTGDDDFDLVNKLVPMVERHEREHVRPFIEKCNIRVQQPIRDYIHELNEAKGGLTKQRHNKLLDFEMYRDKYNSTSSNTKSTSTQVEEARIAFESARVAFDEIDQQTKQVLRDTVIKRYTVFHPVVAELYGDILSEYYEAMAGFGHLLKSIRSCIPPETIMPEPFSWRTESDTGELDMYPTTTTTNYSNTTTTTTTALLPPNPSAVRSTPPLPSSIMSVPEHLNRDWYYLDMSNEQKGPIKVADFKRLLRSGEINTSTYVVTEGMPSWETLSNHELYKYVQ